MVEATEGVLGTYTLRRPIKRPNGESTGTLHLREPSGRDIRRCGFPFSIDTGRDGGDAAESIRLNHGVLMRYLEALSGMTSTDIDTLHPADVMRMSMDVVGFFGIEADETPATSSPATSTSP